MKMICTSSCFKGSEKGAADGKKKKNKIDTKGVD